MDAIQLAKSATGTGAGAAAAAVREAAGEVYQQLIEVAAPIVQYIQHEEQRDARRQLDRLSHSHGHDQGHGHGHEMGDNNHHHHREGPEPLALLRYLDLGEEYLDELPIWPIVVFIISAMACFACSAVFHLFYSMSPKMAEQLVRLDYAGIAFLIGGSNIPMIYYMLYCHPGPQQLYMLLISLGCLATFVVTVHPRCAGTAFRTPRVLLFITLGLFGSGPFVHYSLLDGFTLSVFLYLVAMGGLYIGGACIYITQVPERCFPGRFDIFCSSHQWWHMFVFAAALTHYFGVHHLYTLRILNVCPVA